MHTYNTETKGYFNSLFFLVTFPSYNLWAAQALGVLVEEMMSGGWSLAASWGIISG